MQLGARPVPRSISSTHEFQTYLVILYYSASAYRSLATCSIAADVGTGIQNTGQMRQRAHL